ELLDGMPRDFRGHIQPAVGRQPAEHRASQRGQRRLSRCASVSHFLGTRSVIRELGSGKKRNTSKGLSNSRSLISDLNSSAPVSALKIALRREVRLVLLVASPLLEVCNAPAPHNFAAAPRSKPGNIAPPFPAAPLHPLAETRRATAPASDHSNISRSEVVA